MDILVAYDVNTETHVGRRRLRQVATICQNYGQRVQQSVFECRVNQAQYESLKAKLISIIDPKLDNLRFYKLPTPREQYFEQFGIDHYIDFDELLII